MGGRALGRALPVALGIAFAAGSALPAGAAVPSMPPQPQVSPGNSQITVTFSAPASNGGKTITAYTATCIPVDENVGDIAFASNAGAVAPIVVTGVTNGAAYTCSVHARNADGFSNESPNSAVVVVGTPATPAQPLASAGHSRVSVAFSAPADNGHPITSYTARCTSSTGVPGANTGATSPITIEPLTNGASYTCTVTATNAIGTSPPSPSSAAVTPFVAAPGVMGIPTAAPGDTKISVSFSPPADNGGSPITSYTASCNSGTGTPGTIAGGGSPITVTGLTNGANYTCTVTATNAIGTSPLSPPSSSVMPAPVPDAPPQPVVAARSGGIQVSFTAPADNGTPISGYTATCASNDGGVPAAKSGAGSPITVTGLSNGRTYTCTVRATSAVGAGPPSAPSLPVIPTTLPSPPTLRLAAPGDNAAVVSFTPSPGGVATSFGVACTSTNAGAPGVASGPKSPITVPGLSNGAIYTCTVRATNGIGTSAPSAPSRAFIVGTPGAPVVTHVVSGFALGPTAGMNITFNPGPINGSPISEYRAICRQDFSSAATAAFGLASPIQVVGLLTGRGYTCSVVATNSRGTSAASNAVHAVVGAPTVPPITHVLPIRHGVVLAFVAPSNNGSRINFYQERCTSTNGGVPSNPVQLVSPAVANTLTVGRTYTCTLAAVNARGEGATARAGPFVVSATQPPQVCHGAAGLLRLTPGLQLKVPQSQSFAFGATFGSCAGPYVQQAKMSLSLRSGAISCQTAIGSTSSGTGTLTWTAPPGLGNSAVSIRLVLASTAGHETLASFHGTVTSKQNMFSNAHVTGTVILNRGIAGASAGGDCPATGRISSFAVTAITMTIS